jgi:hypothetical protein
MTPRTLFLLVCSLLNLSLHAASSHEEVALVEHNYFSEHPEWFHLDPHTGTNKQVHSYVSGPQGIRQFAQTGLLDTDFFESGFSLSVVRGPSVSAAYKRHLNDLVWVEVRDVGGSTSISNHRLRPEHPKREHAARARRYVGNTFVEKPNDQAVVLQPLDVTSIQFSFSSPQFLIGQTRSYRYGLVDISAGIRPWKVMVYNQVVPVQHMELSAAVSAYSTVWQSGRLRARLFGSGSLDVTIPGRSAEWGMMVGHVPQLRLMAGAQAALSVLRCGYMAGIELGGAEWRMVQDEQRYADRVAAQKRLEKANTKLSSRWIDDKDVQSGYDVAARSAISFVHLRRPALRENMSFVNTFSLGLAIKQLSFGGYVFSRVNGTDATRWSGGVAVGWRF